MITSELFHRLKYHQIKSNFPGTDITSLIGFDSEADTKGRPFLFGFGDKRYCTNQGSHLLQFLEDHYIGTEFAVWNLKYDSGAIIYNMPRGSKYPTETKIVVNRKKYYKDNKGELHPFDFSAYGWSPGKIELWEKGKTTWTYLNSKNQVTTIKVQYIPHKLLKLTWGKDQTVKFWDVCQFFESSLDQAALFYLKEGKGHLTTKHFTKKFISENFNKIKRYCIRDAWLTQRLGNYFLSKLSTFGIRATSLYSSAALSFRYFQDHGRIIGIDQFWKHEPEVVKMGIDAYEGGKFEITSRGSFPKAYEYDIVSAYPYELSNLADISFAKVKINNRYEPSAYYGFIRCMIDVSSEKTYLPCGLIVNNTRVYAIGRYYITITKAEYEYLLTLNVKVTIITASWFFIENVTYPYRETVNTLFQLKHEYKKKDTAIYQVIKICLNGFYGKMCQVIRDYKDDYNAGAAFNPFYGAIITANCRIRVAQMQNRFQSDCLAVHTDSIILNKELPEDELSSELGGWEKVVESSGVILACGCYQLGPDVYGFKGFEPPYKIDRKTGKKIQETWQVILDRYKYRKFIPSKALQVESWVAAVAKGHFNKINKFENVPKKIDLNGDIKRIWNKDDMKAGDYLKKLYHSKPRVIINDDIPKFW
jgi:hypothetical protein